MQELFGHPESPLFGVYHAPRGKAGSARAVLICQPVGQDYIRAHWGLRLLANQLTRKGIHVFRFDYHGLGDSAHLIREIASLESWRRNIDQAVQRLRELAQTDSVMLLGQRIGSLLASQVAMTRNDVNSVVLWDPVVDGMAYLNQQRQMHRQMLDLWVCRMDTVNNQAEEEILGSVYQRRLLDELETTRFAIEQLDLPHLIVAAPGSEDHYQVGELCKIVTSDRKDSWNELEELETAHLRPTTNRQLVKLIDGMFTRFDQLGLLHTTDQSEVAHV